MLEWNNKPSNFEALTFVNDITTMLYGDKIRAVKSKQMLLFTVTAVFFVLKGKIAPVFLILYSLAGKTALLFLLLKNLALQCAEKYTQRKKYTQPKNCV